ncbi:MAG: DUF3313 domain-containing protein [Desulfobacterales bacterium]|jgi:hypothetical protein|nr:DUF3313 domain-containing protein [Desulfobacterales bacterium]
MKHIRVMGICLLCSVLYAITGCAAFTPAEPRTSGFLKDYSNLRPGKGDEALMVYINRGVNFHIYDSVLIDPVAVIYSKDSKLAKLSAQDRLKMANYFHAALENNLSMKYIIAAKPGSLTMRLRFALTDIKESQEISMDNAADAAPMDSAVDQVSSDATGSHVFLNDATVEMEIIDSMTGQRLAAAVDRRSSAWNGVKSACDFWAQRVTQRLDEFAGGDYLLER